MICGMAVGICNIMTLLEGEGYWIETTKEEMVELLRKLEAIQKESQAE